MFETKWGHYWFLDVGCILCQTLVFFGVFWFIGFLVYWFFVFLVFLPLNWDRLGSHKIAQKKLKTSILERILQDITVKHSVFVSFFA